MEGKRTKEAEGPLISEHSKLGGNYLLKSNPDFLQARYTFASSRLKMFDHIKMKMTEAYEKADKPEIVITVNSLIT